MDITDSFNQNINMSDLFKHCVEQNNFDPFIYSIKISEPTKNLNDVQIYYCLNDIDMVFQKSIVLLVNNYSNISFLKLQTEIFRYLRNICAKGKHIQNQILEINNFFDLVRQLLNKYPNEFQLINVIYQCIANLCVQNSSTQFKIWNNLNSIFFNNLINKTEFCNISAMIFYNIFLENNNYIIEYDLKIYKIILNIALENSNESDKLEFVHLIVEHFLVNYNKFAELYQKLDNNERIGTVKYALEIIRSDDKNRRLNTALVKEFISDAKKRSDLILNSSKQFPDSGAHEVILLLELLAIATSQTYYSWIFSNDGSLFLNIGCLLSSVIKLGKQSENIFSPISKLEYLTPNSNAPENNMEQEISYLLKTWLIRIISNLSYKNKKMQDLAKELDIMLAVLECTNIDARNPLIKEWSILAIRNLCENHQENQNIIASLSKLGNAENPILTDQRDEDGSLRIKLENCKI